VEQRKNTEALLIDKVAREDEIENWTVSWKKKTGAFVEGIIKVTKQTDDLTVFKVVNSRKNRHGEIFEEVLAGVMVRNGQAKTTKGTVINGAMVSLRTRKNLTRPLVRLIDKIRVIEMGRSGDVNEICSHFFKGKDIPNSSLVPFLENLFKLMNFVNRQNSQLQGGLDTDVRVAKKKRTRFRQARVSSVSDFRYVLDQGAKDSGKASGSNSSTDSSSDGDGALSDFDDDIDWALLPGEKKKVKSKKKRKGSRPMSLRLKKGISGLFGRKNKKK